MFGIHGCRCHHDMLLAMTVALQSDSEDLTVCTIIFAEHIRASLLLKL